MRQEMHRTALQADAAHKHTARPPPGPRHSPAGLPAGRSPRPRPPRLLVCQSASPLCCCPSGHAACRRRQQRARSARPCPTLIVTLAYRITPCAKASRRARRRASCTSCRTSSTRWRPRTRYCACARRPSWAAPRSTTCCGAWPAARRRGGARGGTARDAGRQAAPGCQACGAALGCRGGCAHHRLLAADGLPCSVRASHVSGALCPCAASVWLSSGCPG